MKIKSAYLVVGLAIVGIIVGGLASWFLQPEPDSFSGGFGFGLEDLSLESDPFWPRFWGAFAGAALGGAGGVMFGLLWARDRREAEQPGHHQSAG